MKRFINDIKKYKHYIFYATKSELKSEVANAYLDWVWWLLEPFFTMIVYSVVFGYILGSEEPHFPVFLYIGIVMWNFFSRNINSSVTIVRANANIVKKIYVPKFILLIVKMLVNGYKMLLSFVVVLVMMVVFRIPIDLHFLYVIPILLLLFVFTFGCGTILMHFGVYLDDLSYIISIMMTFLMYFTGIFYSIKNKIPQFADILLNCNPLALFIDGMRNAMIYMSNPNLISIAVWAVISVILCITGVSLIYKNENGYVKVI